jgi:hypothetical protein
MWRQILYVFITHVLEIIKYQERRQNCEKRLLASSMTVLPPVRMEQLGTHWTVFHGIYYLRFHRKSVEKITFSLNLTKIKGTLHEEVCALVTVPGPVLLRMRNV